MNDSERKGWKLLIRSGLKPSKWQYNGRVEQGGVVEHSFTRIGSRDEIVLKELVEPERRSSRSFFWFAPRQQSA